MSSEEWQSATHKTRKVVVNNHVEKANHTNSKPHDTTKPRFGRGWSKPSTPQDQETGQKSDMDTNQDNDTLGHFHTKYKQPLANLLSDYGEQDPNFDKIKVPKNPSEDKSTGVLSSRGKAPIHIKVVSFGFTYNAPKQIRETFSYSNPIPVIDCREFLPSVPPYLEKSNGLSFQVKRTLLQSCNNDDTPMHEQDDVTGDESQKSYLTNEKNILRRKVNTSSEVVLTSVYDAISVGGHGYAFPLEMTIYVGSDYGCHRSVVYAELLGQSLRANLRTNRDGKITQPVSVETMHRDIDKKRVFQHKDDDPNDRKRKKRVDATLGDW